MKIKGFKFSGINAGIKKNKLDLGLIYSEQPALCVCAFTKNLLKSNSIIVTQQHLKKTNYIRCIIVNSGCANTACGKNGVVDTEQICTVVARKLGISTEEVLIASTGVIGEPLPKQKILSNIDNLISNLSSTKNAILNFAKSIMTTDRKPKIVAQSLPIGNILCIAKGAGMIAPELSVDNHRYATMLVFLLTDINLSKQEMIKIMGEIVVPTFNSFSIDGDTSPNDTIFFVSNCLHNNVKFDADKVQLLMPYFKKICQDMVLKLLYDGEGVTKVVKLIITNCTKTDAQKIAKTISSSLLVKTAVHGADPNWGRILSCCGRSGVEKLNINKVNIWIGKYQVVKNGTSNFVPDSLVRKEMLKSFVEIKIDVGFNLKKKTEYTFFTTDLSKKYVEINSKYKT